VWSFVAFPKSHELTVGGRTCLIFLFMEALLFGLFTACMTCDQVRLSLCPSNQLAQRLEWCRRQLSGIAEGQGGIDRLKGGGSKDGGQAQRGWVGRFADVFGGDGFSLAWLVPVAPQIRP